MECRGLNLLLLIVLAGLIYCVPAAERTLDMAPDAVDDIFSECRDRMMQTVTDGLLQEELQASEGFAGMWRGHGGTCEKQIYGAKPHHLTALQAYGNSGVKFRKYFNTAVQTKGGNATIYIEEFPFKSLHFLLTDALRLLNHNKTCYTVYYGTGNQYTAESGKEVRFGRFMHASILKSAEIEKIAVAEGGTLFNITSCSVVNVENYTCTSEEIEQLISPTEVFRVQRIKTALTDDGDAYNIITLKHTGFLSDHDCYLFPSVPDFTSPAPSGSEFASPAPSGSEFASPAGGSFSPLLSSPVLALMVSFLSLYYCTVTQ